MRAIDEIKSEASIKSKNPDTEFLLEVLLDIRELLLAKGSKE